ncbi:hypothetical protein PIB30_094584 [Stylosanthes scabra]|uniref:Leucine-rich repeat-containing N-terminal plant-type domain-containing protein n=1 Tax=Stylosanthes scabra TaxID=79078 RepID=A0ABU6RWE2_9FABA|nr:hypothetical protein [Stylosanthes scabra]
MAYLKLKLESKIVIGFYYYTLVMLLFASFFVTSVLSDEGEYMMKLMNALKPPGWSNTTHMCYWTGVTCKDHTGRIEQLNLQYMSLRGTVPSGLNDSLTQLKYLDLSNNYLSGPLPSLANLTFLQIVYLHNNFNSIPHGCFHALTSLNSLSLINNNKLAPWNLFPTDLAAHSSQLHYLYLSSTNLMGSLPNLSHFFPSLITVSLSNNNLTSIPQGCFQGLPYLQFLRLENNINLAPWTFPDLIQSKNLQVLNLTATNVMGPLTEIFQSIPNLETVVLSNNNLSGILPDSRGSKIATLHLNDQKGEGFAGPIDVISNMIDLSEAWLQGNSFTGPIPDMSRCTALQDLQLAHNRLTGVVPDSLISLSKAQGNLRRVSLNNNFLQGPMPNFDLYVDGYVNVGDNTTNAFCRQDFEPCDPRGTILLEIAQAFGYAILFACSWRGNNPCHNWSFVACTGDMITTVNLTSQNLTGTISDAFSKLTHLENLYLSGNHLTGSMPENLTTLHQLKNLDVSNNNLSGKIPTFSSRVHLNTLH